MSQDELKLAVARAALDHIRDHIEDGAIIGIGTGSTANGFIDLLAEYRDGLAGTVASSTATRDRLRSHGLPVLELNEVNDLPVYVDGADEANPRLELIKGGGGALTREKVIAAVAREFVCIADQSKYVERLGEFPLPVEVIPMARSYVARQLVKLGGSPVYREGVVTDNGNVILDLYDFPIDTPRRTEEQINNIVGVVTNGLFALRPANVLLLGTDKGVETLRAQP